MSNKIKDETYSDLAFGVYENLYLEKGQTITAKEDDYRVVDSVNKTSGLQAIAVVTEKDYKKVKNREQPNNVIFVSRGSEQFKDWTTNFNQLGTNFSVDKIKENSAKIKAIKYVTQGNSHLMQNPISVTIVREWSKGISKDSHQFIQYEEWVNTILNKTKPIDYSFTGHSLGGALAQFMAVIHKKNATTFAAARSYRILPKRHRDLVNQGYYDDLIKDYRHEFDPVGYVPLGKTIGKGYLVHSASGRIPILGHLKQSFMGIFNSNGDIKIMYDPANLQASGKEFIHLSEKLLKILKKVEQFEEQEGFIIMNLMKSVQQGLAGSCYSELSDSDVSEILQSIFPFYKGQTPSVYNIDVSIELKANLKKTSQYIRKVGMAMQNSASKAVAEDKTEASTFKL